MNLPHTQKALEVVFFGDPLQGALRLNNSAKVLEPGEGQVLVKMRYAALNPSDIFTVKGQYPGVTAVVNRTTGFVPGLEGCGEIVKNGPKTTLPVSTRVALLPTQSAGTWQEYVVVDEDRCISVPDTIEDTVTAQLFVNPLSAWGMLHELQTSAPMKDSQWIVQTAANSALGRADEVIVLEEETDVVSRIQQITGSSGVAAVLDAVGGSIGTVALKTLRRHGVFIGYGRMSGEPIQVVNRQLMYNANIIRGFWLGAWLPRQSKDIMQSLFEMFASKTIVCSTEALFALEDYEKAIERQNKSDRRGKILFRMN
eukprot:jgi/Galph1/1342/GphlegSOOS_G6061.1